MEITGTGDGRLYGYEAGSPPHLISIDPDSAALRVLAALPGNDDLAAFDFAFWSGDFYFFSSPATEQTSSVVRFDPATETSTALGRVDARVIGAGVSTCADPGR